ncbi:MAG: hypothetical protein HY852_25670 [Bradyrhizobium sp.]|uniref:hypothetical protein n=1 Tax=Bradyrhizobium sp. TaxID=376 RepID=UPI0025C5E994|nr:hypothetical protein [Bradyrhizobium sp.]MBI5265197.1 hypothetical protein [Bradyrhizobium sp.]
MAAALTSTASAGAAFAQAAAEKVTLSSLLAKDYAIAGAISTASNLPGLFLRKGSSLYLCFIAETKQSATVATQYCKPVE